MPSVLLIEDEIVYHRMIEHALQPHGFIVYAEITGQQGLEAAHMLRPDIIITDLNLPDISGYEVTRRLRRDPFFASTPIIVLTGQTGLQDKIASFECGADEHITKPFEPEELVIRIRMLMRRIEMIRQALPPGEPKPELKTGRMIAVHTLRGGIGSTTVAVNLALGLRGLWGAPTILLDLVFMAGQVALMLNMPLKRTWADVAQYPSGEIDWDLLRSIVDHHDSGLDLIPAPTFPSEAEIISTDILSTALNLIRPNYEYIIADVPHDFNEISLQILDNADVILMVLAPELSSVRAAAAALDTYKKLGYDINKIKLVLNNTFPRYGLAREKIETALGRQIVLTLPFSPDVLVQSINLGRPVLYHLPDEPFSQLIEDFALYLSTDTHKKNRPDAPTNAWKRVYERFVKTRKSGEAD